MFSYLAAKGVVFDRFITSLAISFLASYTAIWLELFEGFIDTIYLKLYDKTYSNSGNDAPAANANDGDTASTVP